MGKLDNHKVEKEEEGRRIILLVKQLLDMRESWS